MISDNVLNGIHLGYSSTNTISENEVSDSGYSGILMYYGASNNLIVKNVVKNSTEYDLNDLGTSNTWEDNDYDTKNW